MVICPSCSENVDVDVLEIEEGDEVMCQSCDAALIVKSVSPVELAATGEEEEEEDDDDDDEDDEDWDDEEDDEDDDDDEDDEDSDEEEKEEGA